MKGSLWRHGDKVDQIEPGEWPERSGRARVLIEHPDPATVWAEAEAMRDAGYDVAVCAGPTRASDRTSKPTACPLLVDGRCALVDHAVVVESPVTEGRLLEAVADALENR